MPWIYNSLIQPIVLPIVIVNNIPWIQQYGPSAAAALISLIALFVSIKSLRTQRIHNKKSVRPAGHIQLEDSLQGFKVRIVNRGCGPMLITEFLAIRNSIIHHNIIKHLPPNILSGHTHRMHTEPEGYWLAPGGELILLSLKGNENDPDFVVVRNSIRSIISDITIKLKFSDVYDELHPVFVKSLDWYKRSLN